MHTHGESWHEGFNSSPSAVEWGRELRGGGQVAPLRLAGPCPDPPPAAGAAGNRRHPQRGRTGSAPHLLLPACFCTHRPCFRRTRWIIASLGAQMVKNHLKCRGPGFSPYTGEIPWRRKRLPTPVFLPGESRERGAWQATAHGGTEGQTTE